MRFYRSFTFLGLTAALFLVSTSEAQSQTQSAQDHKTCSANATVVEHEAVVEESKPKDGKAIVTAKLEALVRIKPTCPGSCEGVVTLQFAFMDGVKSLPKQVEAKKPWEGGGQLDFLVTTTERCASNANCGIADAAVTASCRVSPDQ